MKIQFNLAIQLFLIVVLLTIFTVPVFAQSDIGGGVPPVPPFVLTPEMIAAFAGVAISVIFNYVPKLSTNYASLAKEIKQAIMLGLMVAVASIVYGLGCAGILSSGLSCDQGGFVRLVWLLVLAIMGNVGTFTISPQTQAVKDAKTPLS
jgi:hypothetical protein